ncbi:MAG: Periplasmic binding protein [Actinomycetota bacterium]|jgi:hypothetical protein|nr:Periplasmic binding protein [Actinomycetota bacterium]
MIAGIARKTTALLVVPLVMGVHFVVPAAHPPPPPTPAYSPPAREESPFSAPDAFCEPSLNRFDAVPPNDPRLKTNPLVVVMLTPADSQPAAGDEAETFAAMVNRCGGIGGRRLELHVLTETGDPGTDCLVATQQLHAVLVASWTASPAQYCVARDQRTLMVTGSDVANADLATTSGRLAATGSPEGVLWARLLAVIDNGQFDGKAVTIVSGNSPGDALFTQSAKRALAAAKIPVVALHRANVVLEPSLDPASIQPLLAGTAAARRGAPLEVYGFSPSAPTVFDELRQAAGTDLAKTLKTTRLFSFVPVDDPQYRMERSPSTFSEMCNQEYAAAVARVTSAPTTTQASGAPLTPEYLRVADVCLAMRVVARSLFTAGVDVDQRSLMRALHRLPYIDGTAPGGTPKPRPNQVLNEPAKRIAQVVVLTQVQAPCTSTPESTTTPSSTDAVGTMCWAPASGWDEGGRVVNVPLPSSP